jgi:hypothetical protein
VPGTDCCIVKLRGGPGASDARNRRDEKQRTFWMAVTQPRGYGYDRGVCSQNHQTGHAGAWGRSASSAHGTNSVPKHEKGESDDWAAVPTAKTFSPPASDADLDEVETQRKTCVGRKQLSTSSPSTYCLVPEEIGSHSVNLFVPLQECCVEAPIKARFDSKKGLHATSEKARLLTFSPSCISLAPIRALQNTTVRTR